MGKVDKMTPWRRGYVVTNDAGIMVNLETVKARLHKVPFAYHRYLDACNMVDCAIRTMMRAQPHISDASEVEDK